MLFHIYITSWLVVIMKLLPPSKPGCYYDSTSEAAEDCNKQTDNEDFWFGGSCVINKKNILMNPASRSLFFSLSSSFNPCNAKGKEMCNKGGCWGFHFLTFVVLIVKIDFGFRWLSLLYFLVTLYCWTQTPADKSAW